jgi:hypothetical protein
MEFDKIIGQLGLEKFFDDQGNLKHDLRSIKTRPWQYAMACELNKARKEAEQENEEFAEMKTRAADPSLYTNFVHTTEGNIHVAMGKVLETVEHWHGYFRDIMWKKKTIHVDKLATLRLGEQNVPALVIQHGVVKRNVGIGWVDQYAAQLSDYERYPVVVE